MHHHLIHCAIFLDLVAPVCVCVCARVSVWVWVCAEGVVTQWQ